MRRIGISGSYGGLNIGDEAILTCTIAQLRSLVPHAEIVIFSRNADYTRQNYEVDRAVTVRQITRKEIIPEVQQLDLLLLGGGGILYDDEAYTFWKSGLPNSLTFLHFVTRLGQAHW
ncbi:polysaccharide pyruvyl transferase family protein [Tolypothrix bouteillei VB521301_2]|uniref:polysaccharide pyruvyl transferase family protein n=1 Tax=Tolypothrix bouteillei TaxID=1246981 RepID=UPI0038B54D8D